MDNDLFRFIVYSICIYIFYSAYNYKSYILLGVGLCILCAHLYKDIVKLKKWPEWTEPCGFILGILLIYISIIHNNKFFMIAGVLKTSAHIRQFILKDNQYYF